MHRAVYGIIVARQS